MAKALKVNQDRLWGRIEKLSEFTDPDEPWTRRAFSPVFMQGREWLAQQSANAGLKVEIDPGGNLIGRLSGTIPNLNPIVIGSHSDTVSAGGRFDGILGVVAGIEVAHRLTETGLKTQHPIEVVDFLSEEPSDFGLSCVGSRAYVGGLDSDMLALTRSDGTTLARGIEYVGGRPDEISGAAHSPDSIAAFLEVHIEQGPVLEDSGIDIGVVTDIAGIHRERIVIDGRADHSGTTPMDIRRDALAGAAQVVSKANRLAVKKSRKDMLVATIGKLDVHPNAVNAVPETVVMTLEVRSGKQDALRQFVDDVLRPVNSLLPEFRVTLEHQQISHVAPTPCDAFLQDAVEKAAESNGYSSLRMPSGAGHDGVFLSCVGPIGMIFTPCLEGRSHTPVEWADAETCAKGANTLLSAILAIDSELS